MLRSTLELYTGAARETIRGLARSAPAMLALVIAGVGLVLTKIVTDPLRFIGPFIQSLLEAGAIGWYLSLLGASTQTGRPLRFSELRDRLGHHLSEVISVLFWYWLFAISVFALAPAAGIGLLLIASATFNPVPEIIIDRGERGMALFASSARFMQQNWPEWIAPHLVVGGMLAAWTQGFGATLMNPWGYTKLATLFGPLFGFIEAGTLAGPPLSAWDVLGAALLIVLAHVVLLFRLSLYRKLDAGSRRTRAWRAKVN
jgi:hypothetical protein